MTRALDPDRLPVWLALATRKVQTNDVSRTIAWRWPAALADGRPIALADVFARMEQLLTDAEVDAVPIPQRVGIPVLQAVALEDRDEIRELWARVLAGAAAGGDVDEHVITLVRQLNPDAAKALQFAGHAWALAFADATDNKDVLARRQRADLADFGPFVEAIPDEERRLMAIARLQALGLLASAPGFGRVPVVPTTMGLLVLHLLGELRFTASS